MTQRGRILPAHRPAHHRESVYADLVEQFRDVARPVTDGTAGLGIRQSDAGPVGGDQPDTGFDRHQVRCRDVEAASETTVRVDDRKAVAAAVLRISHRPSVLQSDDAFNGDLHRLDHVLCVSRPAANRRSDTSA